jgi:hypothetical protein
MAPPHIDRLQLHNVRIKAGQNVNLTNPYSSEPTPRIEWWRNDVPAFDNTRKRPLL